MTALLLATLLAAPAAPSGTATFERLKKLEGNWKSKEGHLFTVRVTASGRAVVGTLTGASNELLGATVFYLDGAELLATLDGASHGAFRLTGATDRLVKLEARSEPRSAYVALTLATPDADTLTLGLISRDGSKDVEESTTLSRAYVDTLK